MTTEQRPRLVPLSRRMRRIGAVCAAVVVTVALVWAISSLTPHPDENHLTQLYNHALIHAGITWNAFDPDTAEEGRSPMPAEIVADLSDPRSARRSDDPMIAEAAEKFAGCKYVIRFEKNDLEVEGSSAVASIEIHGLDGRTLTTKQFLTRSGAPITRRFRSPSLDK